jgi:hypothetical protein
MADFYLAGDSAATLHLGHRVSLDLDLFCLKELRTPLLLLRLQKVGKFDLTKEAWGTLIGVLEGVRVSFFTYPYPLLRPTQKLWGVHIASLLDIGLMKLVAISQSGSRRDFIDLFFICRQSIPLAVLLASLPQKFSGINYSLPHILRSLVYFDEAEKEPMPEMLVSGVGQTSSASSKRKSKGLPKRICESNRR